MTQPLSTLAQLRRPVHRREIILSFGCAAFAAPFAVRAQQPQIPVIGLLDTAPATALELTTFYEGLRIEGYVRNQTMAVVYHSAEGDYIRLRSLAADLVNRRVSLMASIGLPAALAAKNATTTIPIVFAVEPDPVQVGLIPSLNKPGGNVTGVTDLAAGREGKRLALLHELMPTATDLALLVNPDNPTAEAHAQDAFAMAGNLGLQLDVIHASAEGDFDTAFTALARSRAGGLVIGDDELFISASARLAALAVHHNVPAIFQGKEFAAAGGLISYGSNLAETYHQAGVYSGLILKGAAPADLPVYQSSRIEFIVNMRTAVSLGIAVPLTMLSAANALIK
jgi:putative tryptophan/tyrosine transport system substrate-binding protein